MAMSYGNVYVAPVAIGANDSQTVKAFQEAEGYDGPSLIIAYSHCIAHGYDMRFGAEQQKPAVSSGYLAAATATTRAALRRASRRWSSTSPPGRARCEEYMRNETRFRMVEKIDPERFRASGGGGPRPCRRGAWRSTSSSLPITLPKPGAPARHCRGHGQA